MEFHKQEQGQRHDRGHEKAPDEHADHPAISHPPLPLDIGTDEFDKRLIEFLPAFALHCLLV